MSAQHTPGPQMQLFPDADGVEQQVQAILARRRAMNASGQAGEDIAFIRAAIATRSAA
ncbi:hypothetical protein [Variovorax boronicumulans]|uniref:hypothetical protein n=1 Tax=Variovorax boronicumulans TaxID=436515 RepID=UPI00132FC492|nr:hypothetical protein [Variovorax boronicumulans]